jgi:hypothetical protein
MRESRCMSLRVLPRSTLHSDSEQEVRYCWMSKQMSLLNFALAVICLFEARVPEVDTPPLSLDCRSVHCLTFWDSTVALNWQFTSGTKYKDDISLLI